MNMQLFLSTLRTAINTDENVAGGGTDDGTMRHAIDALVATFIELQEVLDMPMMQYTALTSFLVRSLGRQPLETRITQSKKVLGEVWQDALSYHVSDSLESCVSLVLLSGTGT